MGLSNYGLLNELRARKRKVKAELEYLEEYERILVEEIEGQKFRKQKQKMTPPKPDKNIAIKLWEGNRL